MIEVKEFVEKNYDVRQVSDDTVLISKTFKEGNKTKYKLRIILDHEGFDPEAEFNEKSISFLRLQVNEDTTVTDIEVFFENAYNAISKVI